MIPPRLNRRLILERAVLMPDGAGGFARDWESLGTLWAEITPGTSRLADRPGTTESRQPLRVKVRGAPTGSPSRPRPGQRLREGVRLYPIASVIEADPEGRFLLCLAHEEAAL